MSNNTTMLKLAWGNHENLPKTSEVGMLYVTKDEGSMYIGLNANNPPVRLSGTVQFYKDKEDWQKRVSPPYSPDVIYYIANTGSLIRWTGDVKKDGDGNITEGGFKIINVSVDTFNTALTSINDTLAQTQTRLESHGDTLTSYGTTLGDHNTTLATHEGHITRILESLGLEEGAQEGDGLVPRVVALEGWRTSASNSIASHETSIESHNSTLEQHSSTLTDHLGKITANTGNINKLLAFLGNIDTEENRVVALEKGVSTNADNISSLTTNLTTNYQTKADATAAHDEINQRIDTAIEAANASFRNLNVVTFKGSATTVDVLKTITASTDHRVGDTYVIATDMMKLTFSNLKDQNLYAGDLVIATGTEDSTTGKITENFEWIHVTTGYQESHNQELRDAFEKAIYDDKNSLLIGLLPFKGDFDATLGLDGGFAITAQDNLQITPTQVEVESIGRKIFNYDLSLKWIEF